MANIKHDRNGVRTASDVERKYKMGMIEPTAEEVDMLKNETLVVDDYLSTTSTHSVQNKVVTQNLNNKVNKEDGKGLSSNDFTDEYKSKVDNAELNAHTHSNKNILDNISNADITNWNYSSEKAHTHVNKNLLDELEEPETYDLNTYKAENIIIDRGICVEKFQRVCINATCTIDILANTETTIFNFPNELKPSEQIDFIAFDAENHFGSGYLSSNGELKVKFLNAVNSVKLSLTYDIGGDVNGSD